MKGDSALQARVVAEMKEVEEGLIGKARFGAAPSSRRASMDRSRSSGPRDLLGEGGGSLGLDGPLSSGGMDDRDADLPDAFLQVCPLIQPLWSNNPA